MTKTSIDKAVELLKNSEVVAFPTETVYGLAADAWNHDAIKTIFQIKGRPPDNPLIVHIATRNMVHDFAADVSEEAQKLMDHFWPGPLTLIFPKKPEVLDVITGGVGTIALRWPSHPISQELIFRAGPVVAPSANKSGRPSPTRAEHVKEDFGEDFPVIDGGATQIGLESTVLDVSNKPFKIYRPGYVGKEELEKVIERQIIIADEDKPEHPKSPGTKYSHYSPDAEVRWLKEDEEMKDKNTLYLLHTKKTEGPGIISYSGNFEKFANELYDRFRQADHNKLATVAIEKFTDQQKKKNKLVQALDNRISKAAGAH